MGLPHAGLTAVKRLSRIQRIGGIVMSGDAAVGIADRMTTGTNRRWPLGFACVEQLEPPASNLPTAATTRTSALLPSPRRRATAGPARRPRQCVSKKKPLARERSVVGAAISICPPCPRHEGDDDRTKDPLNHGRCATQTRACPHIPFRGDIWCSSGRRFDGAANRRALPQGRAECWARRSGVRAAGAGSLLALRV